MENSDELALLSLIEALRAENTKLTFKVEHGVPPRKAKGFEPLRMRHARRGVHSSECFRIKNRLLGEMEERLQDAANKR